MEIGRTTLIIFSDNFITRWMVNHDWKIKIQYSDDARILTTLGTYPKFLSQCLRWSRTTWRSNAVSLFKDGTVWRTQPWSVYAIHLSSFINFALFYDGALFYTLWFAREHPVIQNIGPRSALKYLGLWIFCSKLVKPFPHFWRNPGDLIYLPGYILFGYYHSFIKLYALMTFGVTTWGTRPGVDGKLEDVTTKTRHSADKEILTELSERDFTTEFSRWDDISKRLVLTCIGRLLFGGIIGYPLYWPIYLLTFTQILILVFLHKPSNDEERVPRLQDSYLQWRYWWRGFLGIFKSNILSTTLMLTGIYGIAWEAITGWIIMKDTGPNPRAAWPYYLVFFAIGFVWVSLSRRHHILGEAFRLRNIYLLWVCWSRLWAYWWNTVRLLRGSKSDWVETGFSSGGLSE